MAEFWPCKIASHSWTMSTEQYLRTRGRKEAEPMDLSDEVLAELAKELMWPPGRGGDIARAFVAIRDAATAAERAKIRELLCKQCQLKVPNA